MGTENLQVTSDEVREVFQEVLDAENAEELRPVREIVSDVVGQKLADLIEDIFDTDDTVRQIVTESIVKHIPDVVEDYMKTVTLELS